MVTQLFLVQSFEVRILVGQLKLKLNNMSKIIKEQEHTDYSVRTVFTKDLGMFKAEGTIHSCVSWDGKGTCENDITEVETVFILNGKRCNFLGFRELYEKLYGINTFSKFCGDLSIEFQEEYFKQSPYKDK